MNKKERVIWELKIDFKKSFYWRSNLSNLDTITQRPGRKWVWKMTVFGLEIGSGFEEPGGIP